VTTLVTGDRLRKAVEHETLIKGGEDPGEAVFVLTQEHLELPANYIAILSPKRRLAHGGIIVLGGLSVDPLHSGCHCGLASIISRLRRFPCMPVEK
jgi:deoxycytidine triphosphate deaminase